MAHDKFDFLAKEQIERRAYQFFIECGYQHGRDVEQWLAAERELKKDFEETEMPAKPKKKNTRVAKRPSKRQAGLKPDAN